MLKKKISKIVAVIGIVSVLLLSLVLPAAATVNVGLDSSTSYNLESVYPVKSFSLSSKGYGYDPNEEDGTTYFYIDAVYDISIPTIITVDSGLTTKLTSMRSDTSTDYTGINFLELSSNNLCGVSGYLTENLTGFRYNTSHILTYYKTWVPQAQINPYKPKLPLITDFNSSNLNGLKYGFEFSSSKNDSIVVEFEEYLVYNKEYSRPYVQFNSKNFPLGVSNYTCYVTYDYDLVSVGSVGGEPTLETTHVNTTVSPDAWNAQLRVHTVPYFSSNQVIKNLVTTINFKTGSQTIKTWVPSDFKYVQPFARDPENDPFEYLDDFNTVTKWRDITDITSWIGETVADFFDIELFPGIRLSVILGIVITVSVTTWILKLMAGG